MEHPLKAARTRYNLTQQQLASEVGISTRTVSTAEGGGGIGLDARRRLCKYFKKSAEELGLAPNFDTFIVTVSKQGDAIMVKFDENKRKTLAKMGLGTSALIIGSGFSLPAKANTPDLELIENHISSLTRLMINGETEYVAQQAENFYKSLSTKYPGDKTVAPVRLNAGLILATAKEYTLPWYQRSTHVFQIYNELETMIQECSLVNSPLHTRLIARRGRYRRVLWDFDKGIQECNQALSNSVMQENYELYTHFLCECAHIEATRGDEIEWLHKLEKARRDVLILSEEQRTKALNQINYIQGEGYKRFAYHTNKKIALSERKKYANLALKHLDRWDGASIEVPGFEYLVVQVSKAQCMILIDPEEALNLAESIREKVLNYPTLLDKIHRIDLLAHRRLTASDDSFVQLFNPSSSAYKVGGNIL